MAIEGAARRRPRRHVAHLPGEGCGAKAGFRQWLRLVVDDAHTASPQRRPVYKPALTAADEHEEVALLDLVQTLVVS